MCSNICYAHKFKQYKNGRKSNNWSAIFGGIAMWCKCHWQKHIYELAEVYSFVAVLYNFANELVYFIKVEEKSVAENELTDRFGHIVFQGEYYFQGNYLKIVFSKSISSIQFNSLTTNVPLT